MNLEYVRGELTKGGWKKVQPGQHLGLTFDLVGERHFALTKWNILVKVLPKLDAGAAEEWKANFAMISKKSQSLIWGKCFVLCLVAEQVAPEVTQAIKGNSFGLFGIVRLKGGGGNVFIADLNGKQVYGKVPALPMDVHTFSKSAQGLLQRLVALPVEAPRK
jgi:hypothetical protein